MNGLRILYRTYPRNDQFPERSAIGLTKEMIAKIVEQQSGQFPGADYVVLFEQHGILDFHPCWLRDYETLTQLDETDIGQILREWPELHSEYVLRRLKSEHETGSGPSPNEEII